ncbi:hypothetical protein AMECASPLE_010887 [Ameca splendens]|uniref:Uncharacterized protein n=1 Tax=Ameca splendens TaxID=208324 RepID=A0ABV0YBN4_9TELE
MRSAGSRCTTASSTTVAAAATRASLASCQPSWEPNDSFDPIRISAKSTLCSLRRHLTTCPPLPRSSVVDAACQPTMPCKCQGELVAISSILPVRGGLHPGLVVGLSQGNTGTPNHAQTHSHLRAIERDQLT